MSSGSNTQMTIAEVVGRTIAAQGVRDAFGVVGSGNLIVTNALCAGGTRFHHARHEGGAIAMADGYARVTGEIGVCSVHQGPGLTNTMTGLTEAAKSRTPVLLLAGETPAAALTSNFRIDQHGLVESVGAIAERIHGPKTAADDAARAYRRAVVERRPVVLMLPIDLQIQVVDDGAADARAGGADVGGPTAPDPSPEAVQALADLFVAAERPAIIAGRGAVLAAHGAGAREELERLGAITGAVLATSAPANGLFTGLPYALGISGGFASPIGQELLAGADAIVVFGASLNRWTTKHGALINPNAKTAQVDIEITALGRHRPFDLTVVGDAQQTAARLADELTRRGHANTGFRTTETQSRIEGGRWPHVPYHDQTTDEYIDPRTLSVALNNALPTRRQVAVDSGHFLGYPSMFLDVPNARSWLFPNGFQAVGLGLGNAIGAAIANPDTPTVAAIGDGGAFMALPELETAARLKLGNLLVLVYNDSAYGAEVHHFAPMGHDVSLVRFPDADLAEIATAAGAKGATIRKAEDLEPVVEEWLVDQHQHGHPLVLDAKVNPTVCAEWLEEAFRGG
jgi:thiamine pyrophosphate-dependent acetolactate synthase large subunit-like protein